MQITIRKTYNQKNHLKVTNRKCRVCSNKFTWRGANFGATPDNHGCYKCQFWADQLRDRKDAVVIDGEHYRFSSEAVIENPDPNKSLADLAEEYESAGSKGAKGMGGGKILIQYPNGRVVITDDLWHQGTVPAEYRCLLSNNAKFK